MYARHIYTEGAIRWGIPISILRSVSQRIPCCKCEQPMVGPRPANMGNRVTPGSHCTCFGKTTPSFSCKSRMPQQAKSLSPWTSTTNNSVVKDQANNTKYTSNNCIDTPLQVGQLTQSFGRSRNIFGNHKKKSNGGSEHRSRSSYGRRECGSTQRNTRG